MRHRQRAELIGLQGNLLSKHDVARNQVTDGHKTPTNFGVSSVVDLIHVHRSAIVDTVTLSAVAADSVEISCGVELSALLRGQPASQ